MNRSIDDSVEIVRHFARTHPDLILHLVQKTIDSDRAHVGWVRKLLMDEAYKRFQLIGRDLGVIASTDGDTRVASTWIAATLAEIEAGADAVGGRIITNNRERNKLDKMKMALIALNLGIERDLLAEIILRSPTFGLVIEQVSQYQQENLSFFQIVPTQIIANLRQQSEIEFKSISRLNN